MNRTSGSRLFVAAALLACWLGSAPAEAARVYVAVAPPAARVEVRVAAPSARHLWIGGHHRWNGTAHVWVPGRWAVPPRAGVVWVEPHWVHHRNGWYLVEGRWR